MHHLGVVDGQSMRGESRALFTSTRESTIESKPPRHIHALQLPKQRSIAENHTPYFVHYNNGFIYHMDNQAPPARCRPPDIRGNDTPDRVYI